MKELLQTITSTYNNYRGTGKLLALFLVSVLIICLLNSPGRPGSGNNDPKVSPLLFLLSPISGIAYALTRIYKKMHGLLYTAVGCVCIVLVIILGGGWIFASDDYYIADNRLHIKQEYIDVFDALLQEESGTIRICATPDLSSFMKIYSPRFEVMYERPVNADASVYKGDIRAVYDQMSTSTPDVAMVVKLLGNNGYDHILYDRNDTYWNLPLEEFGYELILQVGDYSIYRYARTEQTE